ncbi:hypothetical protein [Eoetvoesiella caeni]
MSIREDFPFEGWIISSTFEPQKRKFVEGDKYGCYTERRGFISNVDIYLTKDEAIKAAWGKIKSQELQIEQWLDTVSRRKSILMTAENSTE